MQFEAAVAENDVLVASTRVARRLKGSCCCPLTVSMGGWLGDGLLVKKPLHLTAVGIKQLVASHARKLIKTRYLPSGPLVA